MSTIWIRAAYAVVLALVVLFTVQYGVAMALPGPQAPEDPGITFRQLTGDGEDSQNRLTALVDQFYADAKDFRDDYVDYQRNGFLAIAGVAAILAVIALVLPSPVNYLRFGILLGAALCLVVAWRLASATPPRPGPGVESILALVAVGEPPQIDFAGRFLRFALSFVGLILLVFIGLWRLTEWPASRRATAAATPAPAAPAPAVAAWAPAPTPAPAPAPVATESTTVITESAPTRVEAPPVRVESPPEAGRWQRPGEGGEPARAPDTAP